MEGEHVGESRRRADSPRTPARDNGKGNVAATVAVAEGKGKASPYSIASNAVEIINDQPAGPKPPPYPPELPEFPSETSATQMDCEPAVQVMNANIDADADTYAATAREMADACNALDQAEAIAESVRQAEADAESSKRE